MTSTKEPKIPSSSEGRGAALIAGTPLQFHSLLLEVWPLIMLFLGVVTLSLRDTPGGKVRDPKPKDSVGQREKGHNGRERGVG